MGALRQPRPGEFEYNTLTQAAQLGTVLTSYGIDDAILVAHDQSAPVSIEYLSGDASRVQRLVLLNGFYALTPSLTPPKGIEVHADSRLDAVERAMELDPAAVEAFFRFQMDEFIVSAPNELEMIDRLWDQFPGSRPAFIAQTNDLYREVFERTGGAEEKIRQITTPVTIVYGAEDPYLTPGTAREFDDLFPNSTLTLIENAGHFVQIDAPQAVADALRT